MNISDDIEILGVLNMETLESRKSDHLDFYDRPVWMLKEAVELAYQKGYAQGIADYAIKGVK